MLHARDYRETSQIVDFFTLAHGRIAVVARGVRGNNRGRSSKLQPFTRYRLSWSGRTELKTMTRFEAEKSYLLSGKSSVAGFYLNELLWYLLRHEDAHEALYSAYQTCLQEMAVPDNLLDVSLRRFECILLEELGYAIQWDCEAQTGDPISDDKHYTFRFGEGFFYTDAANTDSAELTISGISLRAIQSGQYQIAEARRSSKQLFRYVLNQLLDGRELKSRSLLS